MTWTSETSKGNESGKIRWEIVPYTRGRGVDLGCGAIKAFPHFIGVDNGHHEQFGYNIKPDILVETCSKLDIFGSQSMDFVYSSHLLEHIDDTEGTLKEWWRLVKPGGFLVLYLPHKNLYPNIGQPGANPDHKHDFLPEDIIRVMEKVGCWDLVRNEDREEKDEYSFFQVYKKIHRGREYSYLNPRPEKKAAVIRYGAFGDAIQSSSILPALQRQGYHITFFTNPRAFEVLQHDPHIDEFFIQDQDQVPNGNLGEFWDYHKKKFDKWINLSESVEATLLALPGRSNHSWPHALRHKHMNVNYLEFTHALAELPFKPEQKFYATPEEKNWARKERQKMGEFVIAWSLAGSSVHKTWPYLDSVIARTLITYPNVEFVLMGGPECQMLEAGWEEEKRVHLRSGKWSIRESLSFVEQCDLVIGPETGVLNSVALLPMPKIITLSHSSVENLTKHWVNTISLTAKTPCYPCHRMHYNFTHCLKNEETGTAQCQADIGPDQMWDAIVNVTRKEKAA